MDIKKDLMYKTYICYLNYRLLKEEISSGEYQLLKISGYYFEGFKKQCENKEFKEKVDGFMKTELRDEKIDDIVRKDEDFFNLNF